MVFRRDVLASWFVLRTFLPWRVSWGSSLRASVLRDPQCCVWCHVKNTNGARSAMSEQSHKPSGSKVQRTRSKNGVSSSDEPRCVAVLDLCSTLKRVVSRKML